MKKHTQYCPCGNTALITDQTTTTAPPIAHRTRSHSNSGSQAGPSPSPATLQEEDEVQQPLQHQIITIHPTVAVQLDVNPLLQLLESRNYTSVDYAFGQLINASLNKKLSL